MNCLFCNKQCIGKNNVCQDCSTSGQEYYCNVSKSHDPIKHMNKREIQLPTQEEEIKKRILLLIDSYDKETDKRRKEIWLRQIERVMEALLKELE